MELVVAITLLAIVAAAAVPLLVIGAKAANAAKFHTQAKNLSQQRIESMRDMQFHVDRQNGPFVDMLDVYYTNATTGSTITLTRGSETSVGTWVSSGGTAPEPTSGAFYRVRVSQLPGYTNFSQVIDTQFLSVSGSPVATASLSGYDSQVEGVDDPPSLMVGVTVITSWSDHGKAHSYSNYTRITDSRGTGSLVTTQGSGELMRLTSAAPSGNAITVDVASAQADGSVTTGSTATAAADALQATDSSSTPITAASGVSTSPSNNTSGTSPVNNVSSGGTGCGWVGAVATQVGNVSASTTSGLPKAPSNVDTASPPSNQVYSALWSNGGGSTNCGLFSFANQSTSYDTSMMLGTDYPLVRVPNATGSAAVGTGSAWVTATTESSLPHSVTAGAGASINKQIQIFPGIASWTGGPTDGQGLVDITLTSSNLTCTSTYNTSSGVAQTSAGSYSVTIDVWTTSGRKYVTSSGTLSSSPSNISWASSTTSPTDPLAALNPSSIPVWTGGSLTLTLANFISSWSTALKISETNTSGVHELNSIVKIVTQPTRSGDPLSAVTAQIGNLSCAAEDNR